MQGFLPVNAQEMREAGIEQLDFIFVTGDAYVDHPSFAHALISRYLVAHGYSVGILAQPDMGNAHAFEALGRPRLGFLVGSGNLDSMVNLYSVNKKKRAKDVYAPGGKQGKRPEYACVAYTKRIRAAYGEIAVILGGIEASLRRFAHYDYWSGQVKPSVLQESGADLLVYGMGERAILQIAEALDGGLPVRDVTYVEGTVYRAANCERVYDYEALPSYAQVKRDKRLYAQAFELQMHRRKCPLVQQHDGEVIVQNIPAEPLSQQELDFVYALPYQRTQHPMYAQPVPALEEVRYSITATRGCIGACAFCALYYHQGKDVVWRSERSVLEEADAFLQERAFKGNIHDVGGPTANFYGVRCTNPKGRCDTRRCLTPKPCRFLKEDHQRYLRLLQKLREKPGIKNVYIRSGIRYDFALLEREGAFIRQLAKHYVSGQLKLAPEHVSGRVLRHMGKPEFEVYERFCQKFNAASARCGKAQYVLPYFMSSHPGCTLQDAIALAEHIRDSGFMPEQAQDFYPTPGTLATCMFHTGIDPQTGKPVEVIRKAEEKNMQRALIHYKMPENRAMVRKALQEAGREDLIGFGKKCLVSPAQGETPKGGTPRKPERTKHVDASRRQGAKKRKTQRKK